MSEHTPLPDDLPLPWRVSTKEFNYTERRHGEMASIMSAETDEWFIASILNVPYWERAAQHIVTAVNERPALLSRLQKMEEALRASRAFVAGFKLQEWKGGQVPQYPGLLSTIDAALSE